MIIFLNMFIVPVFWMNGAHIYAFWDVTMLTALYFCSIHIAKHGVDLALYR